jgi:hypothetical protein
MTNSPPPFPRALIATGAPNTLLGRFEQAAHERFGLAYGQSLLHDLMRRALLVEPRQRQQRPRVPHFQIPVLKQLPHRRHQVQKAQQVGHCHSRFADGIRHLLLRQFKLFLQAQQRVGFLERVEILALDVLDQRHRDRAVIGDIFDDDRDAVETCHLAGTPTPFTGDDLVTTGRPGPDDDRLHHPLSPNRRGQFLQTRVVDVPPRLQGSAMDGV